VRQRYLKHPLAKALLSGRVRDGESVRVRTRHANLILEDNHAPDAEASQPRKHTAGSTAEVKEEEEEEENPSRADTPK
jgi:hypothetical protein